MTAEVIPFKQLEDVTGMSFKEIHKLIKDKNWSGFLLHWDNPDSDTVVIERTT